jgi:hypothetical protein
MANEVMRATLRQMMRDWDRLSDAQRAEAVAVAATRAEALVAKWLSEADEADADGDFCCGLTRRNDAQELEKVLNGR